MITYKRLNIIVLQTIANLDNISVLKEASEGKHVTYRSSGNFSLLIFRVK